MIFLDYKLSTGARYVIVVLHLNLKQFLSWSPLRTSSYEPLFLLTSNRAC